MSDKHIVLLVGGVGGAKLAYGLYHSHPPENLTIIVNTGDDFWHYGLRICPDIDTITYTLSGLVNKKFGWGVADDTFTTFQTLKTLGEAPWFQLGDKDLALHMVRTQRHQRGETLTAITQHITQALGIKSNILPMCDDAIETVIDTVEQGALPFQEYFVKNRWQPTIKAIRFEGLVHATMSDAVREAIQQADAIILGPSNPWLSINPILSVPGLRNLISEQQVPRIGVTPIIGGDAVKGPTAKIMQEFGLAVNVQTVVEYYGDVLNGFVFDQRDAIPTTTLQHAAFDTLMDTTDKRITLARNILNWLADWNNSA